MACYEIKNLSFSYPGQKEKCLDGLSLTVESGEFLTVCGKSGCGKTTLLRHLKPSIMPHGEREGVILFGGTDIEKLHLTEESVKIGFVQQNPDNMLVTDKVWREMSFGLENLGVPSVEIQLRVAEMTAFFGLQDMFQRPVSELSGGQKQILNLASVLVMNPTVLVLDEPTSQLDPIAAHEFLETLKKVNRELGVTVIISEHRTEEVFAISDRVAIMDKGDIIAVDKPSALGKMLCRVNPDVIPMLPTAMRVYAGVDNDLECPVTVADGVNWLGEMTKNRPVKQLCRNRIDNNCDDVALSLKEVFFRYEKDSEDVLRGVSVKIRKGEVYGIVGGNGFGKSTLLSVMGGIEKPQRGKVELFDGFRVGIIPQNPVTLFLEKTIKRDLMDIYAETNIDAEQKENEVKRIARLCKIEHILERHPYDVSGGEQQRAALAKILLLNPELILMDEPTKGMDAVFKKNFGDILHRLKKAGVTIVIVSHDIEFCAEYTDRCAMMFDGKIIGEDVPEKFFLNNRFYTTAASRMAKHTVPDAILADEIIDALGGKVKQKTDFSEVEEWIIKESEYKEPKQKQVKKTGMNGIFRILCGLVFAGLFTFVYVRFSDRFIGWKSVGVQILEIMLLVLSVTCFIPGNSERKRSYDVQEMRQNRRQSKRTLVTWLVALIIIPLTVFVGTVYFGDRRYYLISILIIMEIMLPFFLVFEGRKPQIGELVIISVICAVAVGGRIAFAAIPQFKPMLAMVIIAGVCFGGETGFLVGAICGFVSNFYFGQGPWTVWQMVAFGIVGFVAGVLFKKGLLRKTRISLSVFGAFSAIVVYGVIVNLSSVFMMHQQFSWGLALSYMALGFPFDVIHAVATAAFLWVASPMMIEKIERIKTKYGIIR